MKTQIQYRVKNTFCNTLEEAQTIKNTLDKMNELGNDEYREKIFKITTTEEEIIDEEERKRIYKIFHKD